MMLRTMQVPKLYIGPTSKLLNAGSTDARCMRNEIAVYLRGIRLAELSKGYLLCGCAGSRDGHP